MIQQRLLISHNKRWANHTRYYYKRWKQHEFDR